mmetsp:Transcript_19952/g.46833  ORF Transcript_19952/g.46833 Transcript_19952/m.46833 type:complete len:217 (-) Transcript_19952:1140-1790(-)
MSCSMDFRSDLHMMIHCLLLLDSHHGSFHCFRIVLSVNYIPLGSLSFRATKLVRTDCGSRIGGRHRGLYLRVSSEIAEIVRHLAPSPLERDLHPHAVFLVTLANQEPASVFDHFRDNHLGQHRLLEFVARLVFVLVALKQFVQFFIAWFLLVMPAPAHDDIEYTRHNDEFVGLPINRRDFGNRGIRFETIFSRPHGQILCRGCSGNVIGFQRFLNG